VGDLARVQEADVYCWEIDYAGMVALAEQHGARVEALGETKHLSRVFSWLGEAHINDAQFSQAARVITRALAIGEKLADTECIGYATALLMWLRAIMPDRDSGAAIDMEQLAGRVLDIAERLDERYLRIVVYYAMALDLAQRGYLAQASAWASRSIELGDETGYPPASSWGRCIRAYAKAWAEDYEGAVLDAREAARAGQSKYDRLMAKMTLGSTLVLNGDTAEGRRLLEEAKEQYIRHSMIGFMYWPNLVYGLSVLSSGDCIRGLKELEDNFRLCLDLGHRRAAAQAGLVMGEIFGRLALGTERFPQSVGRLSYDVGPSRSDAADRAQASLEHAFELAQDTGMDGIAARALVGLATLANAKPRNDEARAYLARAVEKARPLNWPSLERIIQHANEAFAPGI
jgi:tetratricopeptide (TPR) repeat protein